MASQQKQARCPEQEYRCGFRSIDAERLGIHIRIERIHGVRQQRHIAVSQSRAKGRRNIN